MSTPLYISLPVMGSVVLAVDHDRGILYVNDAEEPEGIMAFSLATGERIRVLPALEGDGPHEFSQRHSGMTMGPGGRLYVSGVLRVVEFDSTGVPVSSWRGETAGSDRVLRRAAEVGGQSRPQGRPDLRGQRAGVHPGHRADDCGGHDQGRHACEANRVSLHAIRRVSGEGCEGMVGGR